MKHDEAHLFSYPGDPRVVEEGGWSTTDTVHCHAVFSDFNSVSSCLCEMK
jgi:hypothetical protein